MEYSPKKMKELLEKHGFSLKKKFGQNFIVDENIIDAIINKSGVDNEIRICKNCGEQFEINKYSKVQVCGRNCMMKLRWKNKKRYEKGE